MTNPSFYSMVGEQFGWIVVTCIPVLTAPARRTRAASISPKFKLLALAFRIHNQMQINSPEIIKSTHA